MAGALSIRESDQVISQILEEYVGRTNCSLYLPFRIPLPIDRLGVPDQDWRLSVK